MIDGLDTRVPSELTKRSSGSIWWVVFTLITVLVIVGGVVALVVLKRSDVLVPVASPSPLTGAEDELNPFAAVQAANPLAGAGEENPFYVNPFAQFGETKADESEPVVNPFTPGVP